MDEKRLNTAPAEVSDSAARSKADTDLKETSEQTVSEGSFSPVENSFAAAETETARGGEAREAQTASSEETAPSAIDSPKNTSQEEEEVEIPFSSIDLDDEIQHKHTNTAKKKKKRNYSFLIFVLVNLVVIGITAIFEFGGENSEDRSKLADIAASIAKNWYYLFGALGCFLGIYLFQVLKVSSMIRVTTGQWRVRATVNSVILGKYYDNITPLAIGGQPFQAYYLSRNKVPVGTATAAPIVQLFLGTLGFITIALIAFFSFSSHVSSTFIRVCAYIGLGINSLTPIAIVFLSVLPNVTTRIVTFFIKVLAKLRVVKDVAETSAKAIGTINDYRTSIGFMYRSKLTLIIGYLLSVLEKISEMSITFFVIMACFNGSGNYLQITAMTIFIYAATSFVPTPGTAGAAEGSFYIVFGSFWPMFIWRLFAYYSYLFFGIVVIISNGVRRSFSRRKDEAEKAKSG